MQPLAQELCNSLDKGCDRHAQRDLDRMKRVPARALLHRPRKCHARAAKSRAEILVASMALRYSVYASSSGPRGLFSSLDVLQVAFGSPPGSQCSRFNASGIGIP